MEMETDGQREIEKAKVRAELRVFTTKLLTEKLKILSKHQVIPEMANALRKIILADGIVYEDEIKEEKYMREAYLERLKQDFPVPECVDLFPDVYDYNFNTQKFYLELGQWALKEKIDFKDCLNVWRIKRMERKKKAQETHMKMVTPRSTSTPAPSSEYPVSLPIEMNKPTASSVSSIEPSPESAYSSTMEKSNLTALSLSESYSVPTIEMFKFGPLPEPTPPMDMPLNTSFLESSSDQSLQFATSSGSENMVNVDTASLAFDDFRKTTFPAGTSLVFLENAVVRSTGGIVHTIHSGDQITLEGDAVWYTEPIPTMPRKNYDGGYGAADNPLGQRRLYAAAAADDDDTFGRGKVCDHSFDHMVKTVEFDSLRSRMIKYL